MDQHEPTPQQLQAEVQDLRARLAQAEAALASQPAMAEQLRLFVEHAPAAIAMLDRDMKYLLASRRWQTEYQLEGQDLIGRSHYEVFPNLSDDWKAFHRRCLAGETIARDEDSFTLADGSLCWLRWAIHPWHDARGAVGGLLIFSEVITARKLAEQELAETQRRCVESLVLLDTLLDKAPVGLAFLDRDFSYVRVNGALAAINGLPAAAHQGRTVADVVPAVWSQLEPILRGLLVGGEPVVNSEITGETAAAPGQTRHWLSSYYPVRIADEIVGIGVIVNEVTQQRQMQQQLQQAQKMEAIGTLAGGVAHEFNNLLQIVGGYSDLMLLRLQPPDPFFDHVRQIKKAADRAAALTQELLAFGRKQLLSPKVLDPNDLVTQVAKLLRHLLDASVELVLSLKPRIGWVEVDPDQLEQALVNLALHARHAMPQGGRLTLETSGRRFDEHYRHLPPGDYVLVQVSDTGPGMDAQTLDRIFEPFFAARPGVRESGIGLAGVYGVVRQSGGHIYAASAPDRGTVYSIYLPQVAPAPADHAAADLSASAPGGTETLLLAANDELLRNYANLLLQAAGYQVLEAEANDRARTLAARHEGPIHLLLVEVGGDHQWVADLQQSRPETKVLFLLATAETAAPVPGASLRLPFAPPVLLQKVREVLDE